MSQLKIKQISNVDSAPGSVIAFDGEQNVWRSLHFTSTFDVDDLDESDVLVIMHELGRKFVNVSVYDENDELVIPDSVKMTGIGTIEVKLSSFVDMITTWTFTIS